MRTFRSVEEIMQADREELARIPEIPEETAESIYRYFHREK